jgi:hypothetical protein
MATYGLYYPYMRVRQDAWLKLAALYWPRLARIVPSGYDLRESRTARLLSDELDFFIDAKPDDAAIDVAFGFSQLIAAHEDQLRDRWRISDLRRNRDWNPHKPHQSVPAWLQEGAPGIAWIYASKMSDVLTTQLQQLGLASVAGPDRQWVGVHPEMAWLYMCAMAGEVAKSNPILQPITDQERAHIATASWSLDDLLASTLGEHRGDPEHVPQADEIVRYALIAVQFAAPAHLANVPTEVIVKVRKRHGAEFVAFRELVDRLSKELSEELQDSKEDAIRERYVQDKIESMIVRPLEDLKASLKGLNIDAATTLVNAKVELPILLAGAAVVGFAHNIAVTTVGAAVGVASAARSRKQARRKQLNESPLSYLLHLEQEANSAAAADRLRNMIARPLNRILADG